jgi:hypothetical protein
MEIDDKFIDGLQLQIDLLVNLEKTICEAIKAASDDLALIKKNKGKSIEEIIPPDQ